MKPGDKLSPTELNTLLNSWQQGTVGHDQDARAIADLDRIGDEIGYGALAQFAQWLYDIQCNGNPRKAVALKRERFELMEWKLPDDFDKVASK